MLTRTCDLYDPGSKNPVENCYTFGVIVKGYKLVKAASKPVHLRCANARWRVFVARCHHSRTLDWPSIKSRQAARELFGTWATKEEPVLLRSVKDDFA